MNSILKRDFSVRRQKLREAILQKCRYISKDKVELLLDQINLNRMYFVKRTDSSKKFLNIITSEFICSPDRKLLSTTIPLLGDFQPGYFIQTVDKTEYRSGRLSENMLCAALKMSISSWEGQITSTYSLIIYEPKLQFYSTVINSKY